MEGTAAGDTIFNSGNVSVTRALVQVGGVSYPVNAIGSVLIQKPKRVGPIIMGIIVAAIGLSAMVSLRAGLGLAITILGVVIGAAGYLKPHVLMFRTASGNQQALRSRDIGYLQQVKQAVETAVTVRG